MKKNLSLDILEARDFELCAKGKRLKLLSQIHRKSLVKRNKNSIHKRISCFSLIQLLSHVRLFARLWTIAPQAPLSMGFSRQEYWSGWPFSSPGDLPHPGIEPRSPALQADSLLTELQGKPHMHSLPHY